jgi:large-conductance mechanosensitive channel
VGDIVELALGEIVGLALGELVGELVGDELGLLVLLQAPTNVWYQVAQLKGIIDTANDVGYSWTNGHDDKTRINLVVVALCTVQSSIINAIRSSTPCEVAQGLFQSNRRFRHEKQHGSLYSFHR